MAPFDQNTRSKLFPMSAAAILPEEKQERENVEAETRRGGGARKRLRTVLLVPHGFLTMTHFPLSELPPTLCFFVP